MRLIDADALGMYLNYWRYGDFSDIKHEREYAVLSDVIEAVHHAPTVDAVERKRGKWIKMTGMMPPEYFGHYECSECGWHLSHHDKTKENELTFCPFCGAEMRVQE